MMYRLDEYRREDFAASPLSRAGQGLCSLCHDDSPAVKSQWLSRRNRVALCQKHVDAILKEQWESQIDCPFCGVSAFPGEACTGCGVGIPWDGNRARSLTTTEHRASLSRVLPADRDPGNSWDNIARSREQ